MRWLTDHWEMKSIALALAIILYFYTGNLIQVRRTLVVSVGPEHVALLPDTYGVSEVIPTTLTFEMRGPKNQVEDLDERDIVPRLVFKESNLRDGQQSFDVTARLLQLPDPIHLEFKSADQVTLTVDRVVEELLQVQVGPRDFDLAVEGLSVRQITMVDSTHVRVRGPQQVVEEYRKRGGVPIESIRIPATEVDANLKEPTELILPLALSVDSRIRVLQGSPRAKIRIEPKPGKLAMTLPLRLMASNQFHSKYTVELSLQEVPLEVSGPHNLLESIRPEEAFTAYVNVPDNPQLDIAQYPEVKVIRPDWAILIKVAPVRLTVRLAEQAAEPTPVPEAPPSPDLLNEDPISP